MKYILTLIALLLTSAVQADWRVQKTTNDMTGESRSVAVSSFTPSVRPMGFPYKGTSVRVIVSCSLNEYDNNKPYLFGYLHFTKAPNVTHAETKNGYNVIPITTRWDLGDIITQEYRQVWGEVFLTPYDFLQTDFVANIGARNTLVIQLSWHGQNRPVFKISMAGSSKALASVVANCNGGTP